MSVVHMYVGECVCVYMLVQICLSMCVCLCVSVYVRACMCTRVSAYHGKEACFVDRHAGMRDSKN